MSIKLYNILNQNPRTGSKILENSCPFSTGKKARLPVYRRDKISGIRRMGSKVDNAPVLYTDFDQIEAQRIAKYGQRFQLNFDQPINSQPTTSRIVWDSEGNENLISEKTQTLRNYIHKLYEQSMGDQVYSLQKMRKNMVKDLSTLLGLSVRSGGFSDLPVSDTDNLAKVLKTFSPDEKKSDFRTKFCTLPYYAQNKEEIQLLLIANARFNNLKPHKPLRSAAGNPISLKKLDEFVSTHKDQYVINFSLNSLIPFMNLTIDELKNELSNIGEQFVKYRENELEGDDDEDDDDDDEGDEGDEGDDDDDEKRIEALLEENETYEELIEDNNKEIAEFKRKGDMNNAKKKKEENSMWKDNIDSNRTIISDLRIKLAKKRALSSTVNIPQTRQQLKKL